MFYIIIYICTYNAWLQLHKSVNIIYAVNYTSFSMFEYTCALVYSSVLVCLHVLFSVCLLVCLSACLAACLPLCLCRNSSTTIQYLVYWWWLSTARMFVFAHRITSACVCLHMSLFTSMSVGLCVSLPPCLFVSVCVIACVSVPSSCTCFQVWVSETARRSACL